MQEWALLASAYATQFVAFSFFVSGLVAILRSQGAPLMQLGWLYLLGLAPGLKFLWAPLFDRYGFGRWGHYGCWLTLMQALLIATLAGMAMLDVRAGAPLPMTPLMAGCMLIALLTACQDIAADGLACRLLGPTQRGLGNAVQMAGGMFGFAMGGGGMLIAYERWGWRTAIICLMAINAITLTLTLLYREPERARPLRSARLPRLHEYWQRLGRFWLRPDTGWRWALLIAAAQASVCLAYGALTPMLVDHGWAMGKIGRIVNIYGSAIGVATTLTLGLFMRRHSPTAALCWMLPAQTLAVLLLGVPLLARAADVWILLGIAGYLALYMPLGALMSALMMERASAQTPATDFSMQYGLYNCAGFALSALALPLAQRWGYAAPLGISAALGLLMCFVAPRLWRKTQSAQIGQTAPAGQAGLAAPPSPLVPTNSDPHIH